MLGEAGTGVSFGGSDLAAQMPSDSSLAALVLSSLVIGSQSKYFNRGSS